MDKIPELWSWITLNIDLSWCRTSLHGHLRSGHAPRRLSSICHQSDCKIVQSIRHQIINDHISLRGILVHKFCLCQIGHYPVPDCVDPVIDNGLIWSEVPIGPADLDRPRRYSHRLNIQRRKQVLTVAQSRLSLVGVWRRHPLDHNGLIGGLSVNLSRPTGHPALVHLVRKSLRNHPVGRRTTSVPSFGRHSERVFVTGQKARHHLGPGLALHLQMPHLLVILLDVYCVADYGPVALVQRRQLPLDQHSTCVHCFGGQIFGRTVRHIARRLHQNSHTVLPQIALIYVLIERFAFTGHKAIWPSGTAMSVKIVHVYGNQPKFVSGIFEQIFKQKFIVVRVGKVTRYVNVDVLLGRFFLLVTSGLIVKIITQCLIQRVIILFHLTWYELVGMQIAAGNWSIVNMLISGTECDNAITCIIINQLGLEVDWSVGQVVVSCGLNLCTGTIRAHSKRSHTNHVLSVWCEAIDQTCGGRGVCLSLTLGSFGTPVHLIGQVVDAAHHRRRLPLDSDRFGLS
ncbi:hypothetical protein BpHYR1_007540 [Brachionus plicatilis]|uniref:Uncharacterized protein n=1 Tax=Brachionus plicatilis TaxID=10195 RepID=A0A3M7S1Z7_BRAPC|nr:hypothetical protein BpHYR1_007540 [Brachionus plicatilis]